MERELRLLRCVTGVSLAIGLLVVLNQLRIPFYLYYPRETHVVLISEPYDLYFLLVTSLCVPGMLIFLLRTLSKLVFAGILVIWGGGLVMTFLGQLYGGVLILYATVVFVALLSVSKADPREVAALEIISCMAPIFVLIESSPLYYWFSASLNPQGQIGLLSEQLELNLTYSLFPVAMAMMLLLLFSWVPLVLPVSRFRGRLVVRYQPSHKWNLRMIAAALDVFAIIAVLVFFYPYLAGQTWIVGVDSYWRYLNPLRDLTSLAPSQVFVASYTHGFYVAFLYLIEVATGRDSFSIVKFAPLLLAFVTSSTVFFAAIRGGWNLQLAFLSAICTLLWLPTTLGIYAGIQANWAAYLLWMLFLSFYFQSRNWSAVIFVLQGLISLAILVVHPWAWGVFLMSLLMAALVSWRTEWKTQCVQGALSALIVALPVAAGTYQASLRHDWSSAVELYASPLIHPASLWVFGNAMSELFLNWGSFLPPLLLLTCLVGVYSLSSQRGVIRNYLVGWIIAWCIGSILVAPSGFSMGNLGMSETGLWRMLYVSPLPILLAVGLQKILHVSDRLQGQNSGGLGLQKIHVVMPVVLVAVSAVLFNSDNPVARSIFVAVVAAAFAILVLRFPKCKMIRLLIASVLILLLLNTAFRSLYPLLLDPHNLVGPISTQ